MVNESHLVQRINYETRYAVLYNRPLPLLSRAQILTHQPVSEICRGKVADISFASMHSNR